MSKREGTAIGVQLSSLKFMAHKIQENKEFYRFVKPHKFEATEIGNESRPLVVEVIKGDTFFLDTKIGVCFMESKGCHFSKDDKIYGYYQKILPKLLSLQDMSDLTRYYIRSENVKSSSKEKHIPTLSSLTLEEFQQSSSYDCAYVVCPREVPFNSLVRALNKHIQQKQAFVGENDYFVWIDIFCASSFLGRQDANPEALKSNLMRIQQAMKQFREVLIYFDTINEPATLTRLWCVWELYSAAKVAKETPFALIFPDKVAVNDKLLIDFDKLMEKVMGLDPTKLKSNNKSNKNIIEHVLTDIEQGFQDVIYTIRATLCKWLTDLVLREYSLVENIESGFIFHIELFVDVAVFLANLSGNFDNVSRIYDKVVDVMDTAELNIDDKQKDYLDLKVDLLVFIRTSLEINIDEHDVEAFVMTKIKPFAEKYEVQFPITDKDLERYFNPSKGINLFKNRLGGLTKNFQRNRRKKATKTKRVLNTPLSAQSTPLHLQHQLNNFNPNKVKGKKLNNLSLGKNPALIRNKSVGSGHTNERRARATSRGSRGSRGSKWSSNSMLLNSIKIASTNTGKDYSSSVSTSLRTSKYISRGIKVDTRDDYLKLLDIQICYLVRNRQYREASKLASILEKENNNSENQHEPRLYGGLSMMSLYFKEARELLSSPDTSTIENRVEYETNVKADLMDVLADPEIRRTRPFLEQKGAYYLAISEGMTYGNSALKTIKLGFHLRSEEYPDGPKLKNLTKEEHKYDLGCSRRAAQVLYFLSVRYGEAFSEAGDEIAKAVYGKDWEAQLGSLKEFQDSIASSRKAKRGPRTPVIKPSSLLKQ